VVDASNVTAASIQRVTPSQGEPGDGKRKPLPVQELDAESNFVKKNTNSRQRAN